MDVLVLAGDRLEGEIHIPSSKSYGQRALAASLLVGKTTIKGLGISADEQVALDIVRTCGSQVIRLGNGDLELETRFDFNTNITLNCGESGLAARMFAGLFMLNQGETTLEGHGSLKGRPMNPLFSIFNQLGISPSEQSNFLPIKYQGKRTPRNLKIDGSTSSQFITGLLYYIVGLRHHSGLRISISDVKSKPYLDMTLQILRDIGAQLEWEGHEIILTPSILLPRADYRIESDWSSASFWIVGAAISGQVILNGLNPQSLQADIVVLDAVRSYGAEVLWEEGKLAIKSKENKAFAIDATHSPDLIPILAVLAVFAEGESRIRGVQRLKYKESDRLNSIVNWLAMLKIPYSLGGDELTIVGKSKIKYDNEPTDYRVFEGYNDHRMVMSNAILALFLNGGKLKSATAIQKSYPDFFLDFEKLGGGLIN